MAKKEVYRGIDSIIFAPANISGATKGDFPTFTGEGIYKATGIVTDSVVLGQEDDQITDVNYEELDDVAFSFVTQKGKRTLSLQIEDLSFEARSYFFGETKISAEEDKNKDWDVENPSFELPLQAIQIKTKAFGEYPAKLIEFTPLRVVAKNTGTIGKNGGAVIEIVCTRNTNFNSAGEVIPGKRSKDATPAA